jgi:steroid delta-isomerase
VSMHAVDRIVSMFESMAPADLDRLKGYYTHDATFKDPFHEVRGLAEIRRIYAHMFTALDGPRFVVTRRFTDGGHCMLLWDFHFRMQAGGAAQVIRGSSHLELAQDGRIAVHRDYWDAAEELYEKVPVLGAFMRFLKRRAAAP